MSRACLVFPSALVVLFAGCGDVEEGAGPWMGMDAGESTEDDAADDDDLEDEVTGAATVADDDHGDGPEGGTRDDDGGGEAHESDGGHDDGGSSGGGTQECPENCYCEPIDPDADLSDLEGSYAPGGWAQTMSDVLSRRWPAGAALVADLQSDPYFGSFTDPSSFGSLMDGFMTEIHEGTHGWDYGHAGIDTFAYFLRGDLQFEVAKVHGFDRSEIYGMLTDDSTSLYAGTYLTGTQGTYGFYELLDEMNCYINGMAAIGVVGEYIPYGISGRDGAVAFLYYLELYLKRARTVYPDLYADLKNDPEYVDLVRTQWLRTHFLMIYAADLHDHIGLYDDEIEANLYDPENMSEIEMFIDHPVEASNCLP
jgi:hypothetical protein